MNKWLNHNTDNRNRFLNEVEKIINNDELFRDFKNNLIFNTVINNDRRGHDTVDPYFKYIQKNKPDLLNYFEKFATLDDVGNPIKLKVGNYNISSGIVIFAYVLSDILLRIGNTKDMDIIEIGSGYGGQSKIIQDYGCKSYTCVDVNPTIKLTKKYLDHYYKHTCYVTYPELFVKDKYDLVISNWCVSEFPNDLFEEYFEKVIKNCDNAFFWSNLWDKNRKDSLKKKLSQHFNNVQEFPFLLNEKKQNYLLICKR